MPRVLQTALLALVITAAPTPAAAVTPGDQALAHANASGELIALINAYRAANGVQPVGVNGALTGAAGWMASDMATKNYLGHVSSDGRSPAQRMLAFGYPATAMYTGEDLAAGHTTASAVIAGWKASPAHNAVLLGPNYNAVGVGVAYNPSSTYKWYWAADFGGPGGAAKITIPTAPAPTAAPAPRAAPAVPVAPAQQQRAAAAPRGADVPAQLAVDPEAEARAALIAARVAASERRFARLVMLLDRLIG